MTAYDPHTMQQLSLMIKASDAQVRNIAIIEASIGVCKLVAGCCDACECCVERRDAARRAERLLAAGRYLADEHRKARAAATAMRKERHTRKVDDYRQRFEALRVRYSKLFQSGDSLYRNLIDVHQICALYAHDGACRECASE